jgi:hypothetical protein
LRLATPREAVLVTGVKRDIALLERVPARAGDEVTVLDISLDKNRTALERILAAGARVEYFDHHYPGEIPEHPNLQATIDTQSETCTGLLVDQALGGRFRPWAVVAAFGDNFHAAAERAAEPLGLSPDQLARLRELGTLINYNGYGARVEDLHFPPDALYRRIRPYEDPFRFMDEDPAYEALKHGYEDDLAHTESLHPAMEGRHYAIYILPAEPWARRVSGVFANQLARAHPDRAHALLTKLPDGGYVVSVRAPLQRRTGADVLCREFPTGGGRQAAAGINHLPEADLERFAARMAEVFA